VSELLGSWFKRLRQQPTRKARAVRNGMTHHSAVAPGVKPTQPRDQMGGRRLACSTAESVGTPSVGKRLRLQCFAGSFLADAPAVAA
jgi:hypothetical protein